MLGDSDVPQDRYAGLPPVTIEVPDDARELARDLQALQRERRAARRRARLRRWLPGRRLGSGLAAPLVVVALLFVALGTTLLSVLAAGRPARPSARPLATGVPVAAGSEGGLITAVSLRFPDGPRDTRTVRPAVLIPVAVDCDCRNQLRNAVTAAQEFALPAILVTGPSPADSARAADLSAGLPAPLTTAIDDEGRLATTYAGSGVTMVMVRPDGLVAHIVRDVSATARLEPLVQDVYSDTAWLPGRTNSSNRSGATGGARD